MSLPPMRPSGVPFQDMCTLLGLMTVSWAWVENSLAMTIGLIQENIGSIKGHPQSPVSLKKKLDCLKVALRDMELLHPFQQEAAVLLKSLKELGARRNDLVHGAAWQQHEGGFQSVNFKVIGGKYAGRDHRFNIQDAYTLNVEIGALSDAMTVFMLKIAHAVTGAS
jgi:hypothetical protein